MEGRQLKNSEAIKFFLAGDAKFTIKHKQSGNHLTYRITKADLEQTNSPWFVSIKTNSVDEHKFKYIGCLWNNSTGIMYRHGKNAALQYDSIQVKVIQHVVAGLVNGELHENFEIWHEGCCGRCGKTLTVPESIEAGFGPECIKMVKSIELPAKKSDKVLIEVINVQELVDKFGKEVTSSILTKLKKCVVENPEEPHGHLVEWSDQHESDCIMTFRNKEQRSEGVYYKFEYTGIVS